MFHNIPETILRRMDYLRALDRKDRAGGTPHLQRLRQIPPETGRFIALLAASAPEGTYTEIGTSGGYSTLWLALACRETGQMLVTFEVLEEKAALARETFKEAQVEDAVKLVKGDARALLVDYDGISFCFLDAEKTAYRECYDKVIPKMVRGGILVADNVISHEKTLESFTQAVLQDDRVDALVVPIGSGLLVCRKL